MQGISGNLYVRLRLSASEYSTIHPQYAYKTETQQIYFPVSLSYPDHTVHLPRVQIQFGRSMFRFALLLLSIWFTVYTRSRAAICTSGSAPLPTLTDCQDIAEAVRWLSRLPGENEMKAWGRRLPTTDATQKVPKVFWISGRGPVTCAIHVDVDAYDLWAIDDFRLSDVASAAEEVIAHCLLERRQVGLAYPAGADGHVHAKVWSFERITR